MGPIPIIGALLVGILSYKLAQKDSDLKVVEPKSPIIYYFTDGVECVDTCELAGWKRKWCYTVTNSWRECSEPGQNSDGQNCTEGMCDQTDNCLGDTYGKCSLSRPRLSLHRTITDRRCLSDCRQHQRSSYNWCRYWKDGSLTWDKCSAIEGHTVTNKKCQSECTFKWGRYMCQTDHYDEEECSPVESRQGCVVRNNDHTTILGTENFWNNQAAGPICFVTTPYKDEQTRRKRSRKSISSWCTNARENLMCGDGESLQNMERARDTLRIALVTTTPAVGALEELRPNDDNNPITSVLRRQIRAGVYRTEFLQATIRSRHVGGSRAAFRGRTTTTNYFRNELNALNDDDRGHLVPDALGGVPADYNLVPQNRFVNRQGGGDLQTLWSVMEARMREFFRTGPGLNGGGHIEYYTMIDYPNETTGRPSAFWVIVRFVFRNAHMNAYYGLIEIYAVNNVVRRIGE